MKILIVCGAGYLYGLELVTFQLIRGLRERGNDVRCVTSTWSDGEFVKKLDACYIPYVRLPLGFISKTASWRALRMTLDQIRKIPALWSGYRRYVREFEPDMVIQSNFHHLFLLWPLLTRQNTCYHVHNVFARTKFYSLLFRFLSFRVSYFIAVSDFVRNSLIDLGIPAERVVCVRNGLTADLPDDESTAPPQARHAEGIRPGSVRIGIAGQIGEWKGHDDLVEALGLLKLKNIPFECLIFGLGDPAYIESLQNRCFELGLTPYVRWMGFEKRTERIFSAIDICVVPSRCQDALPMIAIEAYHRGIPVVAARSGGLPEIVQDGHTGFLVDANSPEQLAEKLATLIEDPALRRRMGSAAQAYALRELTRERMVSQVESTLLRALGVRQNA